VLREFGWDVSSSDFLPLIDACRLIVNVYKHGNGQSLRDLAERYPRYLNLSTSCDGERSDGFLKHEWLSVSSADFDAIAGLRAFWVPSPERSYKVEVTLAPNWQGAPAPKPSNENPIPQ
jgi:hypothetical protein